MARVNLDESSRHDPRILKLARLRGELRQTALGRLIDVWWACYHRLDDHLEVDDVDLAAEADGFAAQLIASRLATQVGDRIRVHGVLERIEYLIAQADRGRRSAEARAVRSTTESSQRSANVEPTPSQGGASRQPTSALLCSALLSSDPERGGLTPPTPPARTEPPITAPAEDSGLGVVLPLFAAPVASVPPARLAPDGPQETRHEAKRHPVAASPHLPAAERLWARQERLRRELNPRTRALEISGKRGSDRIKRVMALLTAGWTEPELELVVESYAAECRRDPAALRWFDGVTNWRPANVDRAIGKLGAPRPMPAATPRSGVTGPAVAQGEAYRPLTQVPTVAADERASARQMAAQAAAALRGGG